MEDFPISFTKLTVLTVFFFTYSLRIRPLRYSSFSSRARIELSQWDNEDFLHA